MPITIRAWRDADLETLRSLVGDASLAPHFDKFQGPGGLEHKLHDPVLAQRGLVLAFVDGEPAGFGVPWVLPQVDGPWAMLRAGVIERFRGRGVGTALARALVAFVREEAGSATAQVSASGWMPNPAAAALAARMGFVHERWFWLMERPRVACPEPVWPERVTVRPYDGGEAMLDDWVRVYNDSFAQHYRFMPADHERVRRLVADPTFRSDGLLLAYRDGDCAGFCRNELHASRGEVGTLGVAQAARGIGLGRALLRWGVRWLETHQPHAVTLLVDGENENALGLYESEGFAIARTREIWQLTAGTRG
jgi:mycothiol synthase